MPARPSLELAVEVTTASGAQYRWAPGGRARDTPTGLTFNTKQSEGFADASLTLPRRIDQEDVDLHLLDDVAITGADGSVAYEGRVAALPRSMQDTHQVTVQAVGWMAHTRDRKMQEIYVDRDLGGWQDMPVSRKAYLTDPARGYRTFGTPAASPDTASNKPVLHLGLTGPWAANAITEAWYDAGAGLTAGQVYLTWDYDGNLGNQNIDTNWTWMVQATGTDSGAVSGISSNLRGSAPVSAYYATNARWVLLTSAYSAAYTGSSLNDIYAFNVAVYGDHGLPLIGDTNPKGVAASDVIRHVIGKYCPKINTSGVQPTTYPIPHLVFKDRTDPYDTLLDVNKYHLWQLAVYENKTLSFAPVDMSDYDWEVRLSDQGVKVDLQGDSTSALANGVAVTFQDVATGRTGTLTPDNHPELKDPNPSNPATLAGLQIWTEIALSSPSTSDAALQIGRAALAEWNQPRAPGTITVQGYIRDRAGHEQPVWKVRAGDRIIIADHPNDRSRLVVETNYTHDSKTVSIAVDSTFKRLDAVLDRLGTALTAANLV